MRDVGSEGGGEWGRRGAREMESEGDRKWGRWGVREMGSGEEGE